MLEGQGDVMFYKNLFPLIVLLAFVVPLTTEAQSRMHVGVWRAGGSLVST